jgi:stage V sporulation protein G
MQVTEVRFIHMEGYVGPNDRLLAFASIVLDGAFVIRDLKVLEGNAGLFVAMPTRKLKDRCHGCGVKNTLESRFCNQCGGRLKANRAERDEAGRFKLHADVCHPIHAGAREMITREVLAAYSISLSERELAVAS